MGEKKRTKHPDAWNPEYGWQLLRRSSSYRKAVDEFLKAATKANDLESLQAFRLISYNENEAKVRRGKVNRLDKLRDPELVSLSKLSYHRALSDEPTVDISTPHYKLFLAWFGDVIRFPVSPETRKPMVRYLKMLWAYNPLRGANFQYLDAFDDLIKEHGDFALDRNENISFHLLAANANFSVPEICQNATEYFRRYFEDNHEAERKTSNKIRWDDFELYLKAYDMYQRTDDGGKKFGYPRVGRSLAPAEYHSESQKTQWARDKVSYVRNELIPIFERQMPKASSSRRLR